MWGYDHCACRSVKVQQCTPTSRKNVRSCSPSCAPTATKNCLPQNYNYSYTRSSSAPCRKPDLKDWNPYARQKSTLQPAVTKAEIHDRRNDKIKPKTANSSQNKSPRRGRSTDRQEKKEMNTTKKTKKEEPKTPKVEEHEYIHFLLKITEDILRNNLYTEEEMNKLFESHVAANRGRLDETRMREQIEKLKKDLNLPLPKRETTCQCDDNDKETDCKCCTNRKLSLGEDLNCACNNPKCPISSQKKTPTEVVSKEDGKEKDEACNPEVCKLEIAQGNAVDADDCACPSSEEEISQYSEDNAQELLKKQSSASKEEECTCPSLMEKEPTPSNILQEETTDPLEETCTCPSEALQKPQEQIQQQVSEEAKKNLTDNDENCTCPLPDLQPQVEPKHPQSTEEIGKSDPNDNCTCPTDLPKQPSSLSTPPMEESKKEDQDPDDNCTCSTKVTPPSQTHEVVKKPSPKAEPKIVPETGDSPPIKRNCENNCNPSEIQSSEVSKQNKTEEKISFRPCSETDCSKPLECPTAVPLKNQNEEQKPCDPPKLTETNRPQPLEALKEKQNEEMTIVKPCSETNCSKPLECPTAVPLTKQNEEKIDGTTSGALDADCLDPLQCPTKHQKKDKNPNSSSSHQSIEKVPSKKSARSTSTHSMVKIINKNDPNAEESEMIYYNPDTGDYCNCTISIQKTALKIQLDEADKNEEYIVVNGPICMPRNILEHKTIPVLIRNASSTLLGSETDLKKNGEKNYSTVNLYRQSQYSSDSIKDSNVDSVSAVMRSEKKIEEVPEQDMTPEHDIEVIAAPTVGLQAIIKKKTSSVDEELTRRTTKQASFIERVEQHELSFTDVSNQQSTLEDKPSTEASKCSRGTCSKKSKNKKKSGAKLVPKEEESVKIAPQGSMSSFVFEEVPAPYPADSEFRNKYHFLLVDVATSVSSADFHEGSMRETFPLLLGDEYQVQPDSLPVMESLEPLEPLYVAENFESPPVVEHLEPLPVEDLEPLPVEDLEPPPVEDLEPLPVEHLEPLPVEDLEPLPVQDLEPLPVEDLAPLPVGDLEPFPLEEDTYMRPESVSMVRGTSITSSVASSLIPNQSEKVFQYSKIPPQVLKTPQRSEDDFSYVPRKRSDSFEDLIAESEPVKETSYESLPEKELEESDEVPEEIAQEIEEAKAENAKPVREPLKVRYSLNADMYEAQHGNIMAQLDEIPKVDNPEKEPEDVTAITDRMKEFRKVEANNDRRFQIGNPDNYEIRRISNTENLDYMEDDRATKAGCCGLGQKKKGGTYRRE